MYVTLQKMAANLLNLCFELDCHWLVFPSYLIKRCLPWVNEAQDPRTWWLNVCWTQRRYLAADKLNWVYLPCSLDLTHSALMTCGLTNTLMCLQIITQQHLIVSDSENSELLNGLTFYSGLIDQFHNWKCPGCLRLFVTRLLFPIISFQNHFHF